MTTPLAGSGGRRPPAHLVKVTTPLALRMAGRRWFPLWAVLEAAGRLQRIIIRRISFPAFLRLRR